MGALDLTSCLSGQEIRCWPELELISEGETERVGCLRCHFVLGGPKSDNKEGEYLIPVTSQPPFTWFLVASSPDLRLDLVVPQPTLIIRS